MDLLTRAALHRARSALDMVDGGPHTPHAKPFPFSALIGEALGSVRELPREIAQRSTGGPRGGMVVRDLTTLTTSGTAKAGNLLADARTNVAVELGQPSVVVAAGARVIDLTDPTSLPTIDGAPSASWVGENAAPSQATPTFALRSAGAKTVSAWINVSRRMRLQTSATIDQVIEGALIRALARAIDAAALGTGGGDTPTGICGTSGVNSVSLGSSGALTRAKLGEMAEAVMADGGIDFTSRPALVIPTAVARKLHNTEAASGSGFLLDWEGTGPTARVCGHRAYVTDGAPAQTAIYGDLSRLTIVQYGGVEILVDPRATSAQGTIRIGAFADVGIVIEQPGAFAYAASVNVS